MNVRPAEPWRPAALLVRAGTAAALGTLALLATESLRAAASDRTERFLFESALTVDDGIQGPAYEAVLPQRVYTASLQPDLRDIGVFDANGQPVPFGLARPLLNPNQLRIRMLAAHAVEVPVEAGMTPPAFVRNADRTIVLAEPVPADTLTERQYILDASELDKTEPGRRYASIALEWRQPRGEFVQPVRLEASDDLEHWSMLVPDATIAYLRRGGGKVLRHKRIGFPATSSRYLRLRFSGPPLRGEAPVILAAALAAHSGETPAVGQRMVVQPEAIGLAGQSESERYEFALPPAFGMSRLTIRTDRSDFYMKVQLWSRKQPGDEWRRGAQATLYDLNLEGARITDSGIGVTGGTSRHWAFAPARADESLGATVPAVEIEWHPHRLVFAPQGPGPYRLAYGSSEPGPPLPDARVLLRRLQLPTQLTHGTFGLPRASLGAEIILDGPDGPETNHADRDGSDDRTGPSGREWASKPWVKWGVVVGLLCVLIGLLAGLSGGLRHGRRS